MARSLRVRWVIGVLVTLALTVPASAGLLARQSTDACPLSNDDCCQAIRLTCCDEAPGPVQAPTPGSTQILRVPVVAASAIPPLVQRLALDVDELSPAASAFTPPHRLLDLPVRLRTLLI